VVPHSHIDLEWLWTYDQSEAFSTRILRQALQMLKKDPRFTFTQDQMQALKRFWDSVSDTDKSFLRRAVSEGRFEVVTGMFVQPDVNEPDFESPTRQLLLAKPWMEATSGAKILTAWNVDTFGQTIQMPQLFRRAGLRYFFFSRDLPPPTKDSASNLFYWRSPDGSKVLAHLGNYGAGLELRRGLFAGMDLQAVGMKGLKALIEHNPEGNDKIMLPWGSDDYLPTETSAQIEGLVRDAASKIGISIKAVLMSTPSRYFEDVENSGVSLPTYTYDFNPPLALQDLRGVWGERPEEKLPERPSEDVLEPSEKISSIAGLYGEPYPLSEFTWAWKRILANQNHDTVGGSHADPTYHVAVSRYGGALEAGRQALADGLFHLPRKIDTSRSGDFPLLVFNAPSFPRTEVIRYARTFFQETNLVNEELKNFCILDPAANPVPFRVVAVSRTNTFTEELTGGAGSKEEGPVSMADKLLRCRRLAVVFTELSPQKAMCNHPNGIRSKVRFPTATSTCELTPPQDQCPIWWIGEQGRNCWMRVITAEMRSF
jgi:alpha-mannosidase